MIRASAILTRTLTLAALLALAACGSEAPAPASAPAPAPVAEPAPAPSNDTPAPAASQTPASDTEAPAADAQAAPDDSNDTAAAESGTAAPAGETPVARAPVAAPEGPEPRLGTDYFVIDPPQMMAAVPGKVEIAEVFSYTCIHCASLESLIPAWKRTLPPEVNFIYAPMSHGAFEPIARGFYASQAMGVLDQTHGGMFKALAEQQKLGRGRLDDIAGLYADLGVDADALKATATSFAVNTQISRSQRTLARWGIESTPTLVVAGKYRAVTNERGHEGMLQTARWLAQREIAEQAATR